MAKAKGAYMSLVKGVKEFLEYGKSQMQQQYAELERQKSDCSYYDLNTNMYYYDSDKVDEIKNQQNELEQSYNETTNILEGLNGIDPSSLKITPVCKIGLAYNNTYVTSEEVFRDLFEEFGLDPNDMKEIEKQVEEAEPLYAHTV